MSKEIKKNFTNKPISKDEVPEDIREAIEKTVHGCKNCISMDELEARAFGEDGYDDKNNAVNRFVDKLFFGTRAVLLKVNSFYKALFKKLWDRLDNDDYLDGFRAGAYFILVCIYIGAAIKAAKDKKGNA